MEFKEVRVSYNGILQEGNPALIAQEAEKNGLKPAAVSVSYDTHYKTGQVSLVFEKIDRFPHDEELERICMGAVIGNIKIEIIK